MPWKDNEVITPTQNLVGSTKHEWYNAKYRKDSDAESIFINSFTPDHCHYCDSDNFRKDGKNSKKIQRYECLDCRKKFLPTTGTIFDSKKIPVSEWWNIFSTSFSLIRTALQPRATETPLILAITG